MSKTNPNQDAYKIGGRVQSDGFDRADAGVPQQSPSKAPDPEKRRGQEGQPNFIPGEAPVGETRDEH